ncbi:MAG: DUF2812 domain-containing protein [Oscillospiraceae bacterium]|nr:DUF2812 domain-containing protein [Oscillospiraceae bacterium]
MLKYNDNARHIHRPIPCPSYDILRMESWLEHMAKEGYFLSRDGFFMGFADFEKAAPRIVKYRMQAARNAKSIFDDGEPDQEEEEFHDAFGWEYVARRGEFHIYQCCDPHAPELNTDPYIQAQTLKAAIKKARGQVIYQLLLFIVYPLLAARTGVIQAAIAAGSFFTFLSIFLFIWLAYNEIKSIVALNRLKKSLANGQMEAPEPWQGGAWKYIAARWLQSGLFIVWVILIFAVFLRAFDMERPLNEFESDPPFATLNEIFFEGDNYEPYNFMDVTNYFEQTSAPLISPNTIIWREAAYFTMPDGSRQGGNLTVYYFEMSHDLLAKLLCRELAAENKSSKRYSPLSSAHIDADYADVYTELFPSMLIRKGNTVIKASFFPYNEAEVPLELWTKIIADSIE